MEFVDTHCHIQFSDYNLAPDEVIIAAEQVGVTKLLCVGCRLEDSQRAIEFAKKYDNIWATIGLHPHEAKHYIGDEAALNEFSELASRYGRLSHVDGVQGAGEQHSKSYKQYGARVAQPATPQSATSSNRVDGSADKQVDAMRKVVAIGECGLDYYYNHSPKLDQELLLRFQIELALENDLPLIFHVREAFEDFWPIFDEYKGIEGVVHSFSAKQKELDEILARGLCVGLNGIMTFTKDSEQLSCAKTVPLDRMLLETDAPFLTPVPFRGKVCQPKHVRNVAEFLASLRGESLEEVAGTTTSNAQKLFGV